MKPTVPHYIFLRHHFHLDLKNEYMMEENPRALWVALKERYDQQKTIILPEARREWSLLRLMDFKSVAEYNLFQASFL